MTNDIIVKLKPMPGNIKGFVQLQDDFYTIVINESLNESARLRTYQREMEHIRGDDFFFDGSASEIETMRH